ncbi:hypothetical protein NQD34_001064 [Periophthalmus magnuspinnatus]|nr:hypothetical protein NQD34_001064 [Periophthalmus magnuspinnatus]
MASLVPNDLEICRACALLVFFLERSVEAYKMVYILYMHPDQEYHVDCCPIGNRVRFETLQALKKDLYFDPEFWNLIALRTNCLKLMNEKVLSAALEEIMEEKWVPSYCRKENSSSSGKSKSTKENAGAKKKRPYKGEQQNHKDAKDKAPARKVGRPRLNKHLPLKKKGNQGPKQWKDASSEPMRRSSFWQLDRLHHSRALDYWDNRRTTRLSERVPAKRMIRTPKWLLEDSGTLDKNSPLLMRRQYSSLPYLPLRRRNAVVKNNTKQKLKSEIKLETEKKQQKEVPSDSQTDSNAPQVVLELSLPDNELLGTFNDEPCNRQRCLPQRLFYKQTLKVLSESLPEKASYRDDLVLKAQNATSFVQMLHSYARKPKGKKIWTKTQGSSSTITRSSGQLDGSNKEQLSDKPTVEMKVTISSQTPQVTDKILRYSGDKQEPHEKTAITKDTETAVEPKITRLASLAATSAESAIEGEVKVDAKNSHSPRLEEMSCTEHISNTNSDMPAPEKERDQISSPPTPPTATKDEPTPQGSVVTNQVVNATPNTDDLTSTENSPVPKGKPTVEDDSVSKSEGKNIITQTIIDKANDLPSEPVQIENKTENLQSPKEDLKETVEVTSAHTESKIEKDNPDKPTSASPSNTAWDDDGFDPTEPQPECEESKLEFCCHFCHKDVKGRHLVAHAMFHYRKDECMFCGVTFKNNLKAMIHLSNHLERLKKLQNPTAAKSPDKPRTKDKRKHKTGNVKISGKIKTALNEKRRGKERKPIPPVRKLRSGYKFRHTTQQEDVMTKAPIHKVNGHIGRRKDNDRITNSLITKTRLRRRSNEIDQNIESERCAVVPVKVEKEEPVMISSELKCKEKKKSKINKQSEINKNIDSRGKLCCPVDGCHWFTVKNQVALFVQHSLEDHHADAAPLELAFHMSNNKCSICKRVLYSFEHFQHHVERHRFMPRHPCPHKGCVARFKTTFEMRRHARKHNPLQAMCCLPGCPKLFICLWQLILHEKDHYSKRSKATQKEKLERTHEKREDRAKKNARLNKNVSSVSIGKSSSNEANKAKDSTVHKKKLSAQSAAATRLLQKLRKRQIIKNNLANNQKMTHKIVSSVGKPNHKLRCSLQNKGSQSKQCLSGKVLPPRQAKSCLHSSDKSIQPEKELKTAIVHKRKEEGEKNTAGIKTRPKVKADKPQSGAKICSTGKILKREMLLPNSEMIKSAGKVELATPVMEENENMDTPDTNNAMATISDIMSSNGISENIETPKIAEIDKMSKTATDESKGVVENVNEVMEIEHGPVVENEAETKMTETSLFKVEKFERELAADFENSELRESKMSTTDCSEIGPINHSTVVNPDDVNEAMPGKDTEENSNMADTISSSKIPINPPVVTPIEQNVASPQNAGGGELRLETTDNATEPPAVRTKAECMPDSSEENVLAKMADASMGSNNDTAFENMIELMNCEQPAADKIVDSTDTATNENTQSSAITSQIEKVELKQISAQTTNESANTANSPNEKSAEGEKRKLKLGNKNDILSALKTLVKSKRDKSDHEGKDSPPKRKNELGNDSASKKFKSDAQTEEVGAASVESSSTSEGNKVETTDSAPAANNANETQKERDKVVKIRRKNKVDLKMKSALTNKKVLKKQTKLKKTPQNAIKHDKPSKKIKRDKSKSETKTVKPKSVSRKVLSKTLSSSNEINGELVPPEGNCEASNKQDGSDTNVNTNTYTDKVEPITPKKVQDETCLKDHHVFDFVPVEEESPLATFEKALSEYKKKPYMRLPATAYLEERFTVMPKRRKDMSMFFGSSQKVPKTPEATAQASQQRQRCANCFTTFSSDQELQWHLQQKCANLFGFDSDDEGTS